LAYGLRELLSTDFPPTDGSFFARLTVPLYYFQISHGRFSGVADCGIDLPDRDAAWVEMAKVCGGLAGTISS
jgi:hypothetical protein